MRKILLALSTLLVAAMLIVSCNKNSPKEVANIWLTNVYHADYEAAMPYSTETTKKMLAQLAQLSSMINDSSKKELKKINITIKDVKEKGDTSIATYMVSEIAKEQSLILVKVNGKWLVEFNKEDSFNGADNSADQPMGADSTSQGMAPADTGMVDTAKH